MGGALLRVLLFTIIPVVTTIGGGAVAAFRSLGPELRSCVQHLAAGMVLSAVAVELLPEIKHEAPLPVIIGFTIGVALMLGLRWLVENLGSRKRGKAGARRLVVALGMDSLIDGVLIGIGFAAGAKQGVLLTIAISVEEMFLGMSAAAAMKQAKVAPLRNILITVGLALLISVGAVTGTLLVEGISRPALVALLAFGSASLLYIVTEELLHDAHQISETPLTSALFFLGFLAMLVIEMVA
jgi:ZIP family zinc transporter